MQYSQEQRDDIIRFAEGKTIASLEYDKVDRYWTMTFTNDTEMSFRFMAELVNA